MCIPIVFLNVHVFGYCILNQNKNKKASLANNTAHVSYCTGKFVSVQHFYNNSISKNEQQILDTLPIFILVLSAHLPLLMMMESLYLYVVLYTRLPQLFLQ